MSYSQNNDIINDPSLLKKYLSQSAFEIDNSAQAVVLYEKGTAITNSGASSFKVERTVKIIGGQALKEATVIVSMGENSSVRKIRGTTYNLEGDEIAEQKIEKSEIIKEKITDERFVAKFNLPSVKEGSIIHYSYIVESPASIFVPDWYFQGNYPKLYSEYEIVIPSYVVFTAIDRTSKTSEKVDKKSELQNCDACFFSYESGMRETNNIWVRRNIPAYKDEPFMLAKDNYIERIKIHVTSISSNGYTKSILKSWDQLNEDIYYKNHNFYGQVFAGNGFLSDKVGQLIANKTTGLDKAKAIFSYVRDSTNYKRSDEYEASNIKQVFKSKEGNLYGINLLLTAMLRKAGINSEPLFLATKSEECLHPLFADPRNINYVVSLAMIDGRNYYLDASEKYMPFGLLPTDCYNGLARSVNKMATSHFLSSDSIKDRTVTMVNVTPSADNLGNMKVKTDYTLGEISGYSLRKKWHNDTLIALKELEKGFNQDHSTMKIMRKNIQNLENPDLPLKISIESEMDMNDHSLIYMDPYFDKFFDKNPFPSDSRMFPVTMDYKKDATYVLSLQLPPDYFIDDFPKPAMAKFEDEGLIEMQNIANYNKEKNQLRIQSRLVTNTTFFSLEEYEPLREFYDRVIEEQSKKVVIKKLN